MSLSKKIDTLDIEFSRFVRLLNADSNGEVKCYTCPRVEDWKEIENGHFIDRRHKALRFELDNCRPQCNGCNQFKSGNLKVYRANLVEELGEDKVAELEQKRFEIKKYSVPELDDLIKFYRELNRKLENNL